MQPKTNSFCPSQKSVNMLDQNCATGGQAEEKRLLSCFEVSLRNNTLILWGYSSGAATSAVWTVNHRLKSLSTVSKNITFAFHQGMDLND
jgi:hypothetical protein